jgi:hypothetical protein
MKPCFTMSKSARTNGIPLCMRTSVPFNHRHMILYLQRNIVRIEELVAGSHRDILDHMQEAVRLFDRCKL